MAALVVAPDGRFLATQRMADDPGFPGYWELPGGKVEDGEEDAAALRRELREELDMDAEPGPRCARAELLDRGHVIDLRVHLCTVRGGPPRLVEVQDVRWLTLAESRVLPFPPLDRQVLEQVGTDGLIKVV